MADNYSSTIRTIYTTLRDLTGKRDCERLTVHDAGAHGERPPPPGRGVTTAPVRLSEALRNHFVAWYRTRAATERACPFGKHCRQAAARVLRR